MDFLIEKTELSNRLIPYLDATDRISCWQLLRVGGNVRWRVEAAAVTRRRLLHWCVDGDWPRFVHAPRGSRGGRAAPGFRQRWSCWGAGTRRRVVCCAVLSCAADPCRQPLLARCCHDVLVTPSRCSRDERHDLVLNQEASSSLKIFISPEWTYPVAKRTEIIN